MLGIIAKIILFIVMLNGKYGVISSDNQIVIPFEYDKIESSDQNLFIATKQVDVEGSAVTRSGAISKTGEIVIPFYYEEIAPFKNVNVTTAIKNGKAIYINASNQIVKETPYDKIRNFENGLAWFQNNGKQGFVNEKMKEVIPAMYTNIHRMEGDIFFAWKTDGTKVILNAGNQVLSSIESQIDVSAGSYQKGIFMTYDMNDKYLAGLRNISGKQILDHEYRELYFSISGNNILAYGRNSTHNTYEILTIDMSGKVLQSERFGYIMSKDDNYFILGEKVGGKMNLGLYKNGVYLLQPVYQQLQFVRTYEEGKPIYQDKLVAQKGKLYGLIDLQGNELIPFAYDRLIFGGGNYYLAKKGNRDIIMTSDNRVVVSSTDAHLFSKVDCTEDAFYAEKNRKWGIINKDGSWLIPAKYERITHCTEK